MGTFSLLMLILLCMYGYSAGSVAQGKNLINPKPRLADLFILVVIWSGGIWARSTLPWNTWLLTLGWAVLAYLAGRLAWLAVFRKPSPRQSVQVAAEPATPVKRLKKMGRQFRALSHRAGAFQARLILSFFFFLVAAPFGLAAKIRDPLRLREGNQDTYWLVKKEKIDDLEQSRRQS